MVAKARFSRLLTLFLAACSTTAAPTAPTTPPGWNFVQAGAPGIVAIELMVISENLVAFFDRATDNPLQIDNHTAWGALWNMDTDTVTPLRLTSDTFCASGGWLSNGTMINVGGHLPGNHPAATDGRMGLRLMEPCEDPTGATCTVFDEPKIMHIAETRWYPSGIRIFDGSFMITGGSAIATPFYNDYPINSIEFFPPKDGGIPRFSPLLESTLPVNMFPRTIALPDGKIFILSNNKTIIYDVENDTETPLPDLPNGVRNSNPLDGAITLLPLHPPDYIPEILSCGGSPTDDSLKWWKLSSQDPASDQCSRLTLTPEGIARGWEVELMPEPRTMGEFILLPNGEVMLINGLKTGYAAYDSVRDPVSNQSNADHPIYTPYLYIPDAPAGQRIISEGMPASDIPRVYHSTVSLTPKGNIIVAGSNPNGGPHLITEGVKYISEFRLEYLNPPYMTMERPTVSNVPKRIDFNSNFTVDVSIPTGLNKQKLKVSLIDLGFSTHSFHQSSRLVFMDATLSEDGTKLTITSPPNNRVYPPGPGFIYVTVDDVPSTGTKVLMGNGLSPPVADQGVPLPSSLNPK